MKLLQANELQNVKGGAVSSTMINAVMRAVSVMFSIGQAVGSAIRRTVGHNYC